MIPGNAGTPGLRAMRAGPGTRWPRSDPPCRASPWLPMDGAENPARDPAGHAGAGPSAAAGCRDDPPAGRARLRIPPSITRQEPGTGDRWPLQDFLELGALLSAVPCARLHVTQVLREWGFADFADSAGLLVTELVANAVRASRDMAQVSAVRLWLLSDSAQILILVWDASPQPPVLKAVADEAEQWPRAQACGGCQRAVGLVLPRGRRREVRLGNREVMPFPGDSHPGAIITPRRQARP